MKKIIIPIVFMLLLILVPTQNAYANTQITDTPTHSNWVQFRVKDGDTDWAYVLYQWDDSRYKFKYDLINGTYLITINADANYSAKLYWTEHWWSGSNNTGNLTMGQTYVGGNSYTEFEIVSMKTGQTYYNGNTQIEYQPPVVIPQPTLVNIIRPSENYTDTVDGYEILVQFKMPINTLSQLVNVKVYQDGTLIEPTYLKSFEYKMSTGEGLVKYFVSPVSVGLHNIEVDINGIKDTSSYNKLGGVVDENGDGIDDRTDLPIGDGHVEPVETESTWQTMVNALQGSKEVFNGLILLCSAMFLWIPTEIRAIVLLAVTITFIIMLKKLLTK